jgi:hypothetical protein
VKPIYQQGVFNIGKFGVNKTVVQIYCPSIRIAQGCLLLSFKTVVSYDRFFSIGYVAFGIQLLGFGFGIARIHKDRLEELAQRSAAIAEAAGKGGEQP